MRPPVAFARERVRRCRRRGSTIGQPAAWGAWLRLLVVALTGWNGLGVQAALDLPIVITQIPRSARPGLATTTPGGYVRTDWFDGARIGVVAPDGALRLLTEGFHSACDPNLSFDGVRMLFAGKRTPASRWRIWELGLDGQGLRPVSPEGMDARNPIHVSTLFTLNSPEPWFTTVFVGREPTLNELGDIAVTSLYNVQLDGTELRRLTFNPNANVDPFQMWDGRVIYAAERHSLQPGAHPGRISLHAIHIEGADMEYYGGAQGRSIQHMPCATEHGLVIFVEPEPTAGDGAGQLACVEERRPHVTYRPLSSNAAHLYLYPSPWKANRVLVSRRSADGQDSCGLFSFDADSGRCEPVYDSPEHHDVQAVVLRPRHRPDGHSTVVDNQFDYGVFYGLNCYDADARMAPHLVPGMVKRVRFIEGVPSAAESSAQPSSRRGPFVPRRLVGEAPVEADGSFNVEVPADTPLLLQTLDERGLALETCGWIWVKPKETRGCIGCHEDPERIPENEYVQALRRPSNRLLLPPAQRRTLSFRNEIAPLLRQHCASAECHGGERTPLRLPLGAERPAAGELEQAYDALLTPRDGQSDPSGTWPRAGRYVDAGRARTSWVVWQLAGEDTSRPWDRRDERGRAQAREVNPMPPPGKGSPLSVESLRAIVQWIDLGAQFDGPAASESRKSTEAP
ncbi:MAG: hypothetical protein KJ072_09925 [Verrucomicrobia bacterium]|nr:hypothetical protein [Verrucomicrobiota bacterium]